MLKAIIVGASGYTGAELVRYILRHPHIQLQGLYVSEQSLDAGKPISTLHGQLAGLSDLLLQPLSVNDVPAVATEVDLVLLATAHEVSHNLAPLFLNQGCTVFDLSGAFRVNQPDFYPTFYGFEHLHANLLDNAVYGLAEWQSSLQQVELIAVPGCYPTASLSALKPLQDNHLLAADCKPVINAVSGVSGAGRKAALGTSFCEVSLNAYGVFNHRHQPEIATHLGRDVVFTPHLGNFKRGILATIYVTLQPDTTDEQLQQAFKGRYSSEGCVRVKGHQLPKLDDVVGTPFCDIGWQRQGDEMILVSAIDNLLKGAASQAIQCVNQHYGWSSRLALV